MSLGNAVIAATFHLAAAASVPSDWVCKSNCKRADLSAKLRRGGKAEVGESVHRRSSRLLLLLMAALMMP